MDTYLAPLAGGALIGLSASLLMLLNGRIAGISGIVGGLLGQRGERFGHDIAFVAGLLLGPLTYLFIFGAAPQVVVAASWPLLIVAGLLSASAPAWGRVAHPATASRDWRDCRHGPSPPC